jgi:uncharacterized membrane protein YgaE (UPF0421/DUF939 family)
VGYGDITPVGPVGKLLSILTIIVGVIFVSVFSAYLSSSYDEQSDEETRKTIEKYMKTNEENFNELKKQVSDLTEYIKKLEEKQTIYNEEKKDYFSSIKNSNEKDKN